MLFAIRSSFFTFDKNIFVVELQAAEISKWPNQVRQLPLQFNLCDSPASEKIVAQTSFTFPLSHAAQNVRFGTLREKLFRVEEDTVNVEKGRTAKQTNRICQKTRR